MKKLKTPKISNKIYKQAVSDLEALQRGECRCWQEEGCKEKTHIDSCPEMAELLMKAYCDRIKDLRRQLDVAMNSIGSLVDSLNRIRARSAPCGYDSGDSGILAIAEGALRRIEEQSGIINSTSKSKDTPDSDGKCGKEFKRTDLNVISICGRKYGHRGAHFWYHDPVCNYNCPGDWHDSTIDCMALDDPRRKNG